MSEILGISVVRRLQWNPGKSLSGGLDLGPDLSPRARDHVHQGLPFAVEHRQSRLTIRCCGQERRPDLVHHVPDDYRTPRWQRESVPEAHVPVSRIKSQNCRVRNPMPLDKAPRKDIVLPETAWPTCSGHKVCRNLAFRSIVPHVVQHGPHRGLERQTFLARGIPSSDLQDLFIRGRNRITVDSYLLEGPCKAIVTEAAHCRKDNPHARIGQREPSSVRGGDHGLTVNDGASGRPENPS